MNPVKVRRMVNNVAFLCKLRQPTKVVFAEVPYLSAISKDATKIYISNKLRKNWVYKGKIINVTQFLILYEKARKALIDLFGCTPQEAHEVATWEIEADYLKKRGIKWEDYDKYLSPQMTPVGKIKKLPPDLDLSRYNERDRLVLSRKGSKDDTNIHQGKLSRLQRNKTTTNIQ